MAALAGFLCLGLSILVLGGTGHLTADNAFNLLYGVIAGVGLVVLAYLIKRLSTISEYAMLRAQLSEAGADILASGRARDDLDELLEYALERLGEQLDATGGVLAAARGRRCGAAAPGSASAWTRASWSADEADLPLAAEAMRAEAAVIRDFPVGRPGAARRRSRAHLRLERVLVVPMRALEREMGVLVYNRPQHGGRVQRRADQPRRGPRPLPRRSPWTTCASWSSSDTRRRDLELVRDSSLDFAQSLDMAEVLRGGRHASASTALRMHVCDIYEVDQEAGRLRILVSYDDGAFDAGEWVGHELGLDYFASSVTGRHEPPSGVHHLAGRPAAQRRWSATSTSRGATRPSSASRCASATA